MNDNRRRNSGNTTETRNEDVKAMITNILKDEEFKNIIKNIFKDEFKKQEEVITCIISSNLKITNDRLDAVTNELNDIKNGLEFTQREFSESIDDLRKNFTKIDKELKILKSKIPNPEDITAKLSDLEEATSVSMV